MISIQLETNLSLEEYQFILDDSGLGLRRPMHDPEFLNRVIQGSNLVVTARDEGRIVGLLRGLTDFSYRTFVADLAVAKNHQRQGIGKKLLEFARNLAPEARLFLFSAEDSEPFYQKLGFDLHNRCYQLKSKY
ncbi:acetyltransferase (GNAT) family protein [Algoriphagus boseongensis]|uniref:Acetyltransferase (GNAT) family protein n=1 Tax=Algoriphagus boseongensis TaxID=1442587 RepID=A0A4R6T909_9BACT|nr:GNAT family N-acetyltransferase [Algoriphagus boseongensis]TDQ19550.1 acetyltransferase (GNAT) family protein [Algoriphagus boseongensis]